jgi:hypothetical protein
MKKSLRQVGYLGKKMHFRLLKIVKLYVFMLVYAYVMHPVTNILHTL